MYTLALNYQTAFEMQDISYLLNPVSNIFESSENTVRFCLISAHEEVIRISYMSREVALLGIRWIRKDFEEVANQRNPEDKNMNMYFAATGFTILIYATPLLTQPGKKLKSAGNID